MRATLPHNQMDTIMLQPAEDRRAVEGMLREMMAANARGDVTDAERCARSAWALPGGLAQPGVHYGLGVAYLNAGQLDNAERSFTAARGMIAPDTVWGAETGFALGLCRLGRGQYDHAAWTGYEARHKIADPNPKPLFPAMRAPEWGGESLHGKRLVVLPEQGLGEEIQFARFAPWLQEMTGAKVTLVCDHRLERLFANLGVDLRCKDVFLNDTFTQRTADAWVMAGGIPLRSGVTLNNLPSAPYLSAALAAPRHGRIGVAAVTRGNMAHGTHRERSLPEGLADALHRLPGAVSLEAGDPASTATVIAGLGLVITVDTTVAHLAGAMGKPVWILLPDFRTDWRWGRGTTASPWYPTAKLYRQPARGDWSTVMDAVRRDLEDLP